MADRFLSELEWKRFSKANQVKDTALGKALAALETAKGPEGELKALDEIDKAVATLKKENKNSVEVSGWLESVGKSADKQRKESEFALKKAAKEESDDEEDDPVLLTSKMIPLLRQVKKGEELQVLVARGGREMAVLMSRKAISNSRRKLLTDYLKDGTPKFHKGTCVFEENSYTFVMDTQAAGMAKKLKAALLKQVELRLKVRVRGPDGDLDDDGEPAEDDGLEAEGEEGTQAKGSVPEAPPLTQPEAPKDAAKAEYEKKWPDLEKRVLELLHDRVGDASKMRAVAEFVREKADAGNYAAALQGMASLQKLIDAVRPPEVPKAPPLTSAEQPTPGAKPEADAETAAFNKRREEMTKAIAALVAAYPAARDQAKDTALKLSEAGVFWRKNERDQSQALFDEAQGMLTWLQDHYGGESDETEAEDGADDADQDGDDDEEDEDEGEKEPEIDPAAVKDHLMMLGSQLKELAGLPEFAEVKQEFDRASLAFRNKSYAEAEALLTQIEPEILAALSAARAMAAQPGGPTLVAVAKASHAWRTACETVRREVAALKGEVIASLEAEDDLDEEELDGVRAELDRLDQIFDKVSPTLTDLMDQAINSPAGKRRESLERVLSVIKRTESDIQSDDMFDAVKDNGLREIDLAAPALTALASLREAVRPALAA